MYKRVVDKYIFTLKFVPDCYKTLEMCEKVRDACLSALKFVPDWFVTAEMLEDLDNANLVEIADELDDDLGYYPDDDLNDYLNTDFDDYLDLDVLGKLIIWRNRYKQHKICKIVKYEKVMPIA